MERIARVGEDPRAPDVRVQQATVNLFADMGVQPNTLIPGLVPATASQDKSRPLSKIVSPLDGSNVATEVISISGTARDSGGGEVAGVEVSIDGGRTWHPAVGEESWIYTCAVPQGVKELRIMSRATDDSGNVEDPRSGITVQIGRVSTL